MRSLVLLAVLAAAVAYGVIQTLPEGQAEADVRPGRPQEVQSVALDGRGLPTSALRAVLATRAGDMIDGARLDADRAALEATLIAHGYLTAKVEPAHVSYDGHGAAYVTFAIAPGPLFHIRSVKVTGATEREVSVVTLARGEAVSADRIERARAAIADRLAARGKHTAVDAKLATDDTARMVDIELAAR